MRLNSYGLTDQLIPNQSQYPPFEFDTPVYPSSPEVLRDQSGNLVQSSAPLLPELGSEREEPKKSAMDANIQSDLFGEGNESQSRHPIESSSESSDSESEDVPSTKTEGESNSQAFGAFKYG